MIYNTNFFNNEYIVSFDPDKTWIEKKQDLIIFCKKTNIYELKNIKKINKIILNRKIKISDKIYNIRTPEIIKWDKDNKILYLKYCNGNNLEFILRNKKTHKKGVLILNTILNFFIENNIFWRDFAPRNIIIEENTIYIVDFEKGFKKAKNYREYLRFNVLEEYCLFLTEKERIYNINDILLQPKEKNIKYKFENIKDKRYVYIAKELGCQDAINKSQYISILKMLIKIEQPKLINNVFCFPGVELDKIFRDYKKEKALKIYSKKILQLFEEKND